VSIDVSEEHVAPIFRVEEISSTSKQVALNGLHGVVSQKLIFFITTAVKTSNSTYASICLEGLRKTTKIT
jgi:hypothetical protein